MTPNQKRIHDANIDIIDWLTSRFADSEFDPETLQPMVSKYYKEASERFGGKESEFENFTVKFISKRISEFKLSNGESKFWSEEEMDIVLSCAAECDGKEED